MLVEAVPAEAQRDEVLAVLAAGGVRRASPGASAASGVDAASARGGQAGEPLSSAELKLAEDRLAAFLGPLAKVLVRRTAQKTRDRSRFYQLLAEELENPAERKAFLEVVDQ